MAVTPSFFGDLMNLSLAGQLTVLPSPNSCLNAGLIAAKCLVKTAVVPLEPAQAAAVIGRIVKDRPDDHQALVMLGGVMADPQAQAVMRRIEGERMRSEGAVVLADQPVF